MAHTLNFKPKS